MPHSQRTRSVSALAAFVLLGASTAWCQEKPELVLPTPSEPPSQSSEETTTTEIELDAVWKSGSSAKLQLKNGEDSNALERLLLDLKLKDESSESGFAIDGNTDGELKQFSFYNKYRLGDRVRTFSEWKRDLKGNTLSSELVTSLLGKEQWSVSHQLRQEENSSFKAERTELSVEVPAFDGGLLKLSGSRGEQGSEIVGEIRGQVTDSVKLGVKVTSRKVTSPSDPLDSWNPQVESKLHWAW